MIRFSLEGAQEDFHQNGVGLPVLKYLGRTLWNGIHTMYLNNSKIYFFLKTAGSVGNYHCYLLIIIIFFLSIYHLEFSLSIKLFDIQYLD